MSGRLTEPAAGVPARDGCPVCLWPDRGAPVCGVCGWQLLGGYVLGPVVPAAVEDLAARLAAAQTRYDLRAAVRVAGLAADRDDGKLATLVSLVRGGAPPPTAQQVKSTEREIGATESPAAETSAGIGFALSRLAAGQTRAIAFFEVGPDGIAVQTLVVDEFGIPRPSACDSLRWADFLPLLPAEDHQRHLRLAGDLQAAADRSGLRRGAGGPGPDPAVPDGLATVVDEAIKPVIARLMAVVTAAAAESGAAAENGADGGSGRAARSPRRSSFRVDTVLVRRTRRWPVLDAMITRARTFLKPAAEIVVPARQEDLAKAVQRLSAGTPLRYGCDLVLVGVDKDSRALLVRPHELFPPGAAAIVGQEPARVSVAALGRHAAARVALPIVTRRTRDADYWNPEQVGTQRPLVSLQAFAGGSTEPVDLTVTLLRPGELEVRASQRLLPSAGSAGWPALLGSLPGRLPADDAAAGPALDLVLLVELGGAEGIVDRRVVLAREVIDAVRDVKLRLRIAVLGYRDHFGPHHVDAVGDQEQENEALVVGCKLGPPDAARSLFKSAQRWAAVPIRDNHAAPVEDALQVIADGRTWQQTWNPAARHVLLTIGGRPPHPSKAGPDGDAMLPCPHRWSWRGRLAHLRSTQSIECFAVLDRRVTPGYAEQAWQELGRRRVYDTRAVTVEQLVRDLTASARVQAVEVCLATLAASVPQLSGAAHRSVGRPVPQFLRQETI